jgi:hypothetical protein
MVRVHVAAFRVAQGQLKKHLLIHLFLLLMVSYLCSAWLAPQS